MIYNQYSVGEKPEKVFVRNFSVRNCEEKFLKKSTAGNVAFCVVADRSQSNQDPIKQALAR
jgi:pyruvoyl-dependent arginine decarboxylase (PvlArgDC)